MPTPRAEPTAAPFDVAAVLSRIRALAAIGPRDAVTANYAAAAASVSKQLTVLGYRVTQQRFSVPAGVSWGVRVPGGGSTNVIADPPGFDAAKPHVVIGAHLDTVPQAPGAEDNASGVSVVVELARMLRQQPAGLPVRLVAFGAEESRGGHGTLYAFGSRHFVAQLSAGQRRVVVGMVALDRVGVRGATVPVCSGGRGPASLAAAIRAATPAGTTNGCLNRASDHVSFEAAGIPAARIGSVPTPRITRRVTCPRSSTHGRWAASARCCGHGCERCGPDSAQAVAGVRWRRAGGEM